MVLRDFCNVVICFGYGDLRLVNLLNIDMSYIMGV